MPPVAPCSAPSAPSSPVKSSSAPSTPRHALDAVGARRVWHYPLPEASRVGHLSMELQAHGITGLVPQQSAQAIGWGRRHGATLAAAGLDMVIGLGKISAKHILDALAVPRSMGCMVNQEDWKSSADSIAVVKEVLKARPDAPELTMDCHYPCLTKDPETKRNTGWHRIAKAWANLCKLRAPQCYWAKGGGGSTGGPWDGWVASRLAWARRDYPVAGGSPRELVRMSRQLYRASVNDHVALLLAESTTGSVWLWNWPEMDSSARLALRVVHALELLGYRSVMAVVAFQLAAGLSVDGVVGPATCGALGLEVPADVLWHRRKPATRQELAYVAEYSGEAPAPGHAAIIGHEGGLALLSPELPSVVLVDPVLVPVGLDAWRVERTGIVLRDVPSPAPWLADEPGR
ncbi:MAG: peptidoglycan-binding domain-containing protein [Polyangiales bacterium]